MRLNLANFLENKTYDIEGDFDFSNADLSKIYNLKKINSCHFQGRLTMYEDFLIIEFVIKTNVTLISSYSLKEFDKNMTIKDHMEFSFKEDDQFSDVIKGNELELDQYILDYVVTSIPTRVIKKGESLPPSKDGVIVLSEEENLNRSKKKTDPRWDKLDELDL